MIRTYKYRLQPTKKQTYLLGDLFFQMQTVYNDALNERRWYWSRSRKSITYYDQWNRIRDERHALPEEMGLLNATSIQQMLRRVDKACRSFYSGLRGAPRFKGKDRFKSIEYRYSDGCKLKGNRLYIQHVGEIRVKLHREIPDDATIKHVVVKRSVGKWYVCLMLDMPDIETPIHAGPAVGIDVGLHSLLAISDGTLVDNPRWLRGSLADLRVLNRKLSRQRRYSKGWRKTARKIGKLQEHIANQRLDFWHKTTRALAETYSTIAVENLNLAFMLKNDHLSLSAHDAALGLFRQLLSYKVEETGTKLIAVNPHNTSQVCSDCGTIVAKGLTVRVHHCGCGLTIDRDVNAARNILHKSGGWPDKALTWPVGARVALEAPPL